MGDIYLWRQLFILFTKLIFAVSVGCMLAFPSVLTPAITASNSTDIRTTSDHASWISAINGVGGLVGSFIMAPIMRNCGRKACHYSLCAVCLIGWAIFPFAKDITALYMARFIQGLSVGECFFTGFMVSEYSHPCRRGYFITLKKTMNMVGIMCCHVMSAFWTWRKIAIFAGGLAFIAMVLTYFWPESPSHLALQGKFAECERSFKWLNGNSEESQKQLKSLIETQRGKKATNKTCNSTMELVKTFLKKNFQKPLLISSTLILSVDVGGRYYYSAYIIQIMSELTGNNTLGLYFSVGADLVTLIAVSTSNVVIRYVKRRTILLLSGITSVVMMLLVSILLYLKGIYMFPNAVLWLIALIVILQSFVLNIGIVPVGFAIMSEIFPLEHKGLGSCSICFVFSCLYFAILKITPIMVEHTQIYGTYGIFGVVLVICMSVLYKYPPETKDKTLQHIEDELNDLPNRDMIVIEREKLMHM